MKRPPTEWGEIFANATSDKGLISKMCKSSLLTEDAGDWERARILSIFRISQKRAILYQGIFLRSNYKGPESVNTFFR